MKTSRLPRFVVPVLMGTGAVVCGLGAGVSVTDGNDEGQSCYVITTDNAVYYYHKEGAGFSSILDKDENDWIGYRQGGGASGNYRGIPNMVHKGGPDRKDNYFHPGHSGGKGSTTTLMSDDGSKAVLKSVSGNGAWEVVWEFFRTHAVMTVNKANGKYWFLYEGTPGGSFDKQDDYWMISDGTRKTCAHRYDGDIPSPEWICFGDNALNRVLVLSHANDDNDPDKFYQMDTSMTVFGFGRSGLTKYLTGTGDKLTIGILEDTSFAAVEEMVNSVLEPTPNRPRTARGTRPGPVRLSRTRDGTRLILEGIESGRSAVIVDAYGRTISRRPVREGRVEWRGRTRGGRAPHGMYLVAVGGRAIPFTW